MRKRKILSIICSVAMLAGMLPISAFAAEEDLMEESGIVLLDGAVEDAMEIVETKISFDEPEGLKELPNIALQCEVTSNLPCYQYHPASEATDGEYDYNANQNGGSFAQLDGASGEDWYLTVDLGSVQSFGTIVLRKVDINGNPANNLKRYQFQISEDGENWKQLGTAEEEEAESLNDVYFTPAVVQQARYVRLYSTNVEGGWKVVDEIEVYTNRLPQISTNYAPNSTLKKGSRIELKAALGADIYYTLDGSDPTVNGTRYEEPIELTGDLTIQACAKKDGYEDSYVSIIHYFMQWIETDPEPGKVNAGTEVTLINQMDDSTIYYTLDGSDPTQSATKAEYTNPIPVESFTRIMAYSKANSGGQDSPVYEFTFTTENAAEGKKITASSEENGTNAGMALDGDPETMWQASANQWIKIDFGMPYDFSCLNINWADEGANYEYIVETSSNNETWYTYASYPEGNNASQTHIIPNAETHRQYIRIKILGANSDAVYGIREIEVAGEISAEVPEIPMYDNPETELYDRVVVNPIPDKVAGVEESQISLDGEWSFTMFPQNGFWRDTTDLSTWGTAKIPGDLDAEGYAVFDPEHPEASGGYDWANGVFYPGNNIEMAYKRQIDVPADFAGQKVFLRVDKAFSYARIWVNGQYVRDHRGEYNAWDADITDYVIPGQKNWITISITAEGSYNDNGQLLGFVGLRSVRGITSDVTLYAASETYLNRLHVITDLDENYEDAELTIMTNTFLADGKEADIRLSLTDMEGSPVALETDKIHVAADDNFTDRNVTVPIENPAKWDAEHPNLYTLTADVVVDGNVAETVVKKIGFREITIQDSVFKINGVATKLRGVDYLTVYGNDGMAYDLDIEKQLLEKLKQNNINYIRAAHYPLSDKTLNLCDELGIFVEQENSMTFGMKEGSNSWPFYKTYLLHACSEMVEKDRSHPSIVIWSIANETSWGENHDATSRYIKAVDPTIPTKFSWGYNIPAGAAIDIRSNHYSIDGVGDGSRPVVWDEYAHGYRGDTYDGSESVNGPKFDPAIRESYYMTIKTLWEQIYSNPINMGGAIWCYTDNVFEGDNRVVGNTVWGQIDVWGRDKPEIWATKNVYSPVQYKGEDSVALPESNKKLVLPYENRYETVNFDDSDFEILYAVNGGEWESLTSHLEAKSTGNIAVPAPAEGWKLGDKITLEFYKTTNGIRRNVVTNVVTIGTPVYVFEEATGTAPEITENDSTIQVAGDDFVLTFSKTTGKIISGTYKEETILVGGPNVNLGNQDLGDWSLNSISCETIDGAAMITIDGSYTGANVGGCTFVLSIDSDGRIDTAYTLKNTSNLGTYEVGVSYDLPEKTDTISWVRDGYLSYYPENQLGRLEGTAVKENDGWEREYGVEPTMEWKDDDKEFFGFGIDDQGGRGTNDFRASKTGFYYAQMGLEGTDALLAVYGDGTGSVRASINEDKTVCLNINNQWGYPKHSLNGGMSEKKVTLRPGYSNTVTMKLDDINNNYKISYDEVAETTSEFIKAVSAVAGSEYSSDNGAGNIINNSGMSSDTVLDSVHDNNGSAYTMWHTKNNPGTNAWIQVDLGRTYALDEMWIWNHNQQNLTERGLKNVKIEYSEDGNNWQELTADQTYTDGNPDYPFQFAMADGTDGVSATNLNDGNHTPVSFAGVTARYVRITAAPTAGDGSWGGTYYGLSEVRFTEYKAPEFINAVGASAGSEWDDSAAAIHLIDNSGMSSETSLDATHTNSGDPVKWHSKNNPGANAWIQVDLGNVYSLDEMWIWNMNMPELLSRGLKNVKIECSEDGSSWTELTTDQSFTDGNPDYPFQFAQGTGEDEMKATNLNDSENSPVSFGGVQARYVKITASPVAGNGTWGDSYYALSEIRFTEFKEEEKPDKTALKELYEECKDLTQDNYTDDSWSTFEAARDAAKEVLDNEEATQEEVNKALEALTKARNDLAEKEPDPVDKSVLEAAIASAESLNAEDYTEESFAPFKEALKNAQAVLSKENAMQEEVDAAVTALTEAQNNLVKKEPSQPDPVDKSVLEAAIARAESLNAEDYTEESWSALEEAKEQAEGVLADENATQEEVNAAVQALNDAQSRLEEKPEEPVKPPVISNIVDKVINAAKKFFCAIAEAVKNWFDWI